MDWLWGAFGLNLGPTWLPLGCPWAPWGSHGVPWGSLGCPLGCLGAPLGIPWGSLGLPWGALGCPGRFSPIFRKLDAQFRANVSICTRLRIEYSLRNSPANPVDPANPAEVASGPPLAAPLPHAGGQDDVSLKETPSNYYHNRILLFYFDGFVFELTSSWPPA